jgi:hypothetical protein
LYGENGMREWKYPGFTPTHEVRETDKEFWIDDKNFDEG